MSKQNKILAVTIMLVAMFQMPQLALTSSVRLITIVFPEYSLSAIQTAMSLTGLLAPVFSILTSFLIRQRLMSKRAVVTVGLIFLGAVGAFSVFFHSQFWHLCVMSILIGMATGSYLPTMTSIMIDNYPQSQVRSLTGYQTSFMNVGGILISLAGGFLVSLMWYGGYFIMLAGFPLALLAVLTIPPEKEAAPEISTTSGAKSKMNPRVFYYAASLFLFMMAYNVGGANLAVHLAAADVTSTTIIGAATAVQMLGGSAAGILFGRLSKRFHDMMIPIAFAVIFLGFTMLNIFQAVLPMIFVAEFLIGTSMSMIAPQCIVSISDIVDERNSATASAIVTCFAPNFGGFVSPVVFTNLTTLLAGPSTNFRYQFVAFYALIIGGVFAFANTAYKRRHAAA